MNAKTREIICTAVGKGKVHDFRLWKESQISIDKNIELLADKGYQGIKNLHEKSRIPFKKSKKISLSQEQKKFNRQLAKERIVVITQPTENNDLSGSNAIKIESSIDNP